MQRDEKAKTRSMRKALKQKNAPEVWRKAGGR